MSREGLEDSLEYNPFSFKKTKQSLTSEGISESYGLPVKPGLVSKVVTFLINIFKEKETKDGYIIGRSKRNK